MPRISFSRGERNFKLRDSTIYSPSEASEKHVVDRSRTVFLSGDLQGREKVTES